MQVYRKYCPDNSPKLRQIYPTKTILHIDKNYMKSILDPHFYLLSRRGDIRGGWAEIGGRSGAHTDRIDSYNRRIETYKGRIETQEGGIEAFANGNSVSNREGGILKDIQWGDA